MFDWVLNTPLKVTGQRAKVKQISCNSYLKKIDLFIYLWYTQSFVVCFGGVLLTLVSSLQATRVRRQPSKLLIFSRFLGLKVV